MRIVLTNGNEFIITTNSANTTAQQVLTCVSPAVKHETHRQTSSNVQDGSRNQITRRKGAAELTQNKPSKKKAGKKRKGK